MALDAYAAARPLVSTVRALEEGDHRLMRAVNKWHPPRWFRLWMICATRGGDGWLWYALGASLLFGGEDGGRLAAGAAALGAFCGIALFLLLKRATRRRRPCTIAAHCWSTLLPPDQFSFPSGHTITAFSVAVPVMLVFPGLSPVLLVCALSVAASRILLGMHFLTDVLAGMALGSLLGWGGAPPSDLNLVPALSVTNARDFCHRIVTQVWYPEDRAIPLWMSPSDLCGPFC